MLILIPSGSPRWLTDRLNKIGPAASTVASFVVQPPASRSSRRQVQTLCSAAGCSTRHCRRRSSKRRQVVGQVMRQVLQLNTGHPRQRLAHRRRASHAAGFARAAQGVQQVVLALAGQAGHLLATGQLGAVAAGAVQLGRQCGGTRLAWGSAGAAGVDSALWSRTFANRVRWRWRVPPAPLLALSAPWPKSRPMSWPMSRPKPWPMSRPPSATPPARQRRGGVASGRSYSLVADAVDRTVVVVADQLQAARLLPVVRGPAHGADGSPPGGPRHSPCAGAPVGALYTLRPFARHSQSTGLTVSGLSCCWRHGPSWRRPFCRRCTT